MTPYQPHLDWIATQAQHMLHLTDSWSRINSGSYHTQGLARMHKALWDNFHWLEGEMEAIDLPPLTAINSHGEEVAIPMGQALRVCKHREAQLQVLLSGHMDTVFAADHPFQEPRYLDENTLNGPGVADLKGGLVVMLKALEALERSEWAGKLGWEVVINPDEEIGSQSSDFLFKEAATRCRLGLLYEPALADGTLAGARKGSGNFTFVVRGVAAHAGREFEKGRNAIVAAGQLAVLLDACNGKREGVTLNIGKIEGGGPLNQVPDLAILRMNIRLPATEDRSWVLGQMDAAMEAVSAKEGISIHRHGTFTRAPKPMSPENQRIFALVKETGALLDLDIAWRATGGCCDGNNCWAYGLPNVDTLGVRGGAIHTSEEFLCIDSLVERSQLSALLLMRLASGEIIV